MPLGDKHLDDICKRGQGAETCAFLTVGDDGWVCAKFDQRINATIQSKLILGEMKSIGNNCEGHEE